MAETLLELLQKARVDVDAAETPLNALLVLTGFLLKLANAPIFSPEAAAMLREISEAGLQKIMGGSTNYD